MTEVLEIRVKTDAPKATKEVGGLQKAFAGLKTVATKVSKSLTGSTNPSLKELEGAAKSVESAISTGATPSLGGLLSTAVSGGPILLALAAAVAVATAGIVAFGASIKIAADTAPLLQISSAFEGTIQNTQALAVSLQDIAALNQTVFGTAADGSDRMLAALQESSAGMISNIELMKQFNSAASLVSVSFAEQLPEAMELLGKVSAATGKDFDFLLNSLTTGVARRSALILDNLNITVDATLAEQRYAAQIGISVDALTKEQEQTALMNQVLERLAVTTAGMPSIVGTATQAFAAFSASGQNLKQTVGGAFAELYAVGLPLLTVGLDAVDTILKSMLSTAGPGFNQLEKSVQNLAKAFKSPEMTIALEVLGEAMAEVIAIGLPIMVAALAASMDKFASIVTTEGPKIVKTFTDISEALQRVNQLMGAAQQGLSIGLGVTGLPGFAHGVSGFRGGMAMVGERGPELVQLPTGSSVHNTTRSDFNNFGQMHFNTTGQATFGNMARQARTAAGAG